MNFSNYKIPDIAKGTIIPNGVYEKMREQEWHEEEIKKEEQQIALLVEQNKMLKEANDKSNIELNKSKCLNIFMAIIASLSFISSVVFGLLSIFIKWYTGEYDE